MSLLQSELAQSDEELKKARSTTQAMWSARRVLVDEVRTLRMRVDELICGPGERPTFDVTSPENTMRQRSLRSGRGVPRTPEAAIGSPYCKSRGISAAPHATSPQGPSYDCRATVGARGVDSASLGSPPRAAKGAAAPPPPSPGSAVELEKMVDSQLAMADMRLQLLLSQRRRATEAQTAGGRQRAAEPFGYTGRMQIDTTPHADERKEKDE